MKYYVVTDNRGYVLTITHTNTKKDFVELDLSKYDLKKIRAYKLGYNDLIFDKEEWDKIQKERQTIINNNEIKELEKKLYDSDYIIARWGEEIVALDNPLTWIADVIKINLKYSSMYKELLKERKTWRERIEELRR